MPSPHRLPIRAGAVALVLLIAGCADGTPLPVATDGTSAPADTATEKTTLAPKLNTTPPTTVGQVPEIGNLQVSTEHMDGLGITADQVRIHTAGSFAVWWDARFDAQAQAEDLIAVAQQVEADLATLGIGRRGAASYGYYTNIYLHRGDDVFPTYFGNGTGYEGDDEGGGPVFAYLAYPFDEDLAANRVNLFHELFHVYQGAGSYHGVATTDEDGPFERAWFIEAMAEWYQMSRVGREELRAFENVHAITATPEQPLWEFFPRFDTSDGSLTEAEAEAIDYAHGIRQYSNGSFLYYLTDVIGLDPRALLDAMYLQPQITPQQQLYGTIGADQFRGHYVAWALANTVGFDYIRTDQAQFAADTYRSFAEPAPATLVRPHAIDAVGEAALGTLRPADGHRPGAWGYNVARLSALPAGSYTIQIAGDPAGRNGTSAHFEAAVAITAADGTHRQMPVPMTDAVNGTITVDVGAGDTEVLIVVASTPESFVGDETFDYSITTSRG